MVENPIVKINVGDLAEPATVLIEKISDAVAGVAAPWHTRRLSKAQADADMIRARAEADAAIIQAENDRLVAEIEMRAMHRSLAEETIYQSNIEDIVSEAVPQLDPQHASPDDMDNDWIRNFFGKARMIGDEEMRSLWARILAGEANEPGTFSLKSVNLLADLSKQDAETFKALCDFIWYLDGSPTIIDIDVTDRFYTESGIDYDSMSRLFELGLVSRRLVGFDSSARMIRGHEPVLAVNGGKMIAEYGVHRLELSFHDKNGNYLFVGSWKLTQAGSQLLSLVDVQPVEEFFETVRDEWIEQRLLTEANGHAETTESKNDSENEEHSVLRMIRQIHESVSDAAWDTVPTDGARNYKHYLYGWPKDRE